MSFIDKVLRRNKPSAVEEPLSEAEMWDLFRLYVSDDKDLAKLVEHTPLGGSVGSRVRGYHRILEYDTSTSHIGMAQLRKLVDLCWQMYDYDPLIKQGVDTRSLYTFGQGVTIGCRKKGSWGTQISKDINDFWFDPCNFSQFTSTRALMSLDVQSQIEGNVPLFFWKDDFTSLIQVRPLKTTWIESLIMSRGPQPAAKVVGYVLNVSNNGPLYTTNSVYSLAKVSNRDHRVAYADIDADPEELIGLTDDVPIDPNGRIAHLKGWGRPWAGIGVPSVIPALDPAQRYGGFLEDWSVVQGLFRTFALSVVSKGTNKGVQDVIRRYRESNFADENNPALYKRNTEEQGTNTPVGHALFTGMTNSGQAGTRIEAIKTAGATEGPERARELKLLLCSAFGLPETMFGDAKVGNHATAHTLERTVDLRAQANQTIWGDFIESILRYVARESRWGEMQQEAVDIFVRFPPIVEHVIKDHVEAITMAYEKGLITDLVATREILQGLHVTDSEEVLRSMYDENNFGKIREPEDVQKNKADIEKAKIQAQAMRDNAKMMAARSTSSSSGGSK